MLKKIVSCAALALTVWVAPLQAQDAPSTLPRTVQAALKRAQIPADALSVFVAPAPPGQAPRLDWQSTAPRNPASVMKLVTTYAALDQLGPAFVWRTPLYLDGVIDSGAFRGTVYIRGAGDPKPVACTHVRAHETRHDGVCRLLREKRKTGSMR